MRPKKNLPALMLIILALTGCGNSLESTTSGNLPQSNETSVAASSAITESGITASYETHQNTPNSKSSSSFQPRTASSTTRPIDSVLQYGASRKAGGDIPSSAVSQSRFVSPSKNIVCMLDYPDVPLCTVINPGKTISFEGYYTKTVDIKDYASSLLAKTKDELDVAPYGSVYRSGSTACAIEEAGVTCWNSATGHGAFMSREHTLSF